MSSCTKWFTPSALFALLLSQFCGGEAFVTQGPTALRGISRHAFAASKSAISACTAIRPGRASGNLRVEMQATQTNPLDKHIKIDNEYPGMRRLHTSPDVFLIDNLLTSEECDDIIERAKTKDMTLSPVAYSGWTEDAGIFSRLLPIATLPQVNSMLNANEPPIKVAAVALAIWGALSAVYWGAAYLWAQERTKGLQALRTSTSVALRGEGVGEKALVTKSEQLLQSSWKLFEAPTVIRYEEGQELAPHFDANRGAQVEDANRGGQTLATLLVYLNDVREGGKTIFNRLDLEVNPTKGQGLLFFPAAADCEFDERVEHQGSKAIDEKWIVRIWRHVDRVPPPFGLPDNWTP